MSNNTYQHVSNESVYVEFDPVGSNFDSSITNVQTALASISAYGVKGVPDASETEKGVIQLATEQEVLDGFNSTKAVTPATLNARLQYPNASETQYGVTKYATQEEAIAGTLDTVSITPLKLNQTIDNTFSTRYSTETTNGVIKIATQTAALAGSDDTTAMTPLKTQQLAIKLISQIAPNNDPASESITGVVRLATVAQTRQGTLREGYAISPYTFMNSVATQEYKGVIRLGTQAEINSNLGDVAVTGETLNGRGATGSMRGVVKLTTQAGVAPEGDSSGALAWNADVINTRGGQTINGSLNLDHLTANGILSRGGMWKNGDQPVATERYASERVPVGTIQMFAGDSAPPGWVLCHGGTISGDQFPDYRNVVGTRFGGDWNNPGIPDMRGLFVRGAGTGSHILNNRGQDGYGKDRLGVGCDGMHVGGVQAQQMSYHKHAGGWGEYQRHEAPFGASVYQGYLGTRKYADWDNASYFTNDGFELGGHRDALGTLNREGLIGYETRPWNISLNYIIKVHY
ncbi:tail fiber protein [Escherichia coli]